MPFATRRWSQGRYVGTYVRRAGNRMYLSIGPGSIPTDILEWNSRRMLLESSVYGSSPNLFVLCTCLYTRWLVSTVARFLLSLVASWSLSLSFLCGGWFLTNAGVGGWTNGQPEYESGLEFKVAGEFRVHLPLAGRKTKGKANSENQTPLNLFKTMEKCT